MLTLSLPARRKRVSDAFYIYSRVYEYAELESEAGYTIQLLIRPIQAFECSSLFDEFFFTYLPLDRSKSEYI